MKDDTMKNIIAIIDYDAGNLHSVENAMIRLGCRYEVTRDPDVIEGAGRVILPGVGAFGDAAEKLRSYGLNEVIRRVVDMGKPFLGICVGLQLLFEGSEESPEAKGLALLPGVIKRIPASADGVRLKIPHMGWNSLDIIRPGKLFEGISSGTYMYFVHSYYLCCDDPDLVTATAEYGCLIHAAVEKGNLFACQFHPEKSGDAGLRVLKNFLSLQEG